ncbi:MAG: hypothetical protein ACOYNM_12580 [Gemmataceae bacterium]|nr:hypothetical protein [Gemmataceae bacterium]
MMTRNTEEKSYFSPAWSNATFTIEAVSEWPLPRSRIFSMCLIHRAN